jgi:hypothetical protein
MIRSILAMMLLMPLNLNADTKSATMTVSVIVVKIEPVTTQKIVNGVLITTKTF